MTDALYGEGGFYRRAGAPASHFRTSAQSPAFAEAVLRLVGRCGLRRVVDVGAGGGELLSVLHGLDAGLSLHGVEVADRPVMLPASIGWSPAPPPLRDALVLANEWLDNVPVEVVESTEYGPRLVLVGADGAESLGGSPDPDDLAWLRAWWPLSAVGDRAEVGRTRDDAWAGLVRLARRCVLVAVDYALGDPRPVTGSLAGYRSGRQVRPVPDGSCDITAHVALDACAAAGERAGATGSWHACQRDVLLDLEIANDPPVGAGQVPQLGALARRGELAELLDPAALGAFGWLAQAVGTVCPRAPAPAPPRIPGQRPYERAR